MVEGPAAEGKAVAGTVVWVTLSLRDRFGNVTSHSASSEHAVVVSATGAQNVTFEELGGDAFQCGLP